RTRVEVARINQHPVLGPRRVLRWPKGLIERDFVRSLACVAERRDLRAYTTRRLQPEQQGRTQWLLACRCHPTQRWHALTAILARSIGHDAAPADEGGDSSSLVIEAGSGRELGGGGEETAAYAARYYRARPAPAIAP